MTTTATPATSPTVATLTTLARLLAPLAVFFGDLRGPVLGLLLAVLVPELRTALVTLRGPAFGPLLEFLAPALQQLVDLFGPGVAALLGLPPMVVIALLAPLLSPLALLGTIFAIRPPDLAPTPAPAPPASPRVLPAPPTTAGVPVWAAPPPAPAPTRAPAVPVPTPSPVPLPPAPAASTAIGGNAHSNDAPVSAVLLWTASLAGLMWLGYVRLRRLVPLSADYVLTAAPG
jgi:hypothetical protein